MKKAKLSKKGHFGDFLFKLFLKENMCVLKMPVQIFKITKYFPVLLMVLFHKSYDFKRNFF